MKKISKKILKYLLLIISIPIFLFIIIFGFFYLKEVRFKSKDRTPHSTISTIKPINEDLKPKNNSKKDNGEKNKIEDKKITPIKKDTPNLNK
ncbi:hypothetical protein ['Camptotheca acuminata' phytoplasma]|uniref:hypothetical protein n=1 Tax='Camptotheca acuminata' phytoplasma TaxID=3239192 RepID=UPI00351A43C1